MAYQFQKSDVASVKISHWRGTANTLNISGINGSLSSADSLVAGVQQFLSISGLQNELVPTRMSRVVTESVVDA